MKYLKKPCNQCPFLKEGGVTGFSESRCNEILSSFLEKDNVFHCHKTTHSEKDKAVCAGSSILLQKRKGVYANLKYRLLKIFKSFDVKQLKGFDLIVDNEQEFIKKQANE